ncbi:MAG: hypothetical protein V4732_16665 [Pseudomonadota bacterium]
MKHIKNIDTGIPAETIAEEDTSTLSALTEGLHQEVEDLVKLELTAEEMLREEAVLVRDYVTNDVRNFWRDLKCEILYWELLLAAFMLRAADPVQVEWQRGHWWGDEYNELQ